MAKICPVTNEKVLYIECLDCDDRHICKDIEKETQKKEEKITYD